MKEKVEYLKNTFDKFLKDNKIYDAWYERYRLDNLMYDDDVPIDTFMEDMINGGETNVHSMLYFGIGDTVFHTSEIDKFIEENKKCDILSNSDMADMDGKWMETWKTLVDVNKIF